MKNTENDIGNILDEVSTKIKAIEKEAQAKCQVIMKDVFEHLFSTFKEVKAVGWTQYTPYFNDGEECTFSVHEFLVSVNDVSETEAEEFRGYEDDNGWYSSWGVKYAADEKKIDPELAARIQAAIKFLQKNLAAGKNEAMMKGTFGDHVAVVARPGGAFQVMDHEHD